MTPKTYCLNCQHALAAHDHYCSQCGQQATVHRLGWHDVSHGLFHYFLHADKSVVGLLKGLATKPGVVAHDYISGRRKHWFSPYTFFLLCVTVFVFYFVFFHSMDFTPVKVNQARLNSLPAAEKGYYLNLVKRAHQVQYVASKYNNLITMLSIPLMGFMLWLGFRKSGLNYFETITSLMYFRGFTALTINLLFAPLMGMFIKQLSLFLLVVGVGQFFTVLYYTWAFHQLLSLQKAMALWKVFLWCLAAQLFWTVISTGAFQFYIQQRFITF